MRTILRLLLILLINPLILEAQITTPVVKANFGVDGDLRAGEYIGKNLIANDDWWPKVAGTGNYVIDTFGAAAKIAAYNSDASPWPVRMASFWRGQSVPTFMQVGTRIWIDALFVRDYHATDTTVFTVASKNGESPADWNPGIQSVPDKNDILDTYMHLRRNGLTSADSLWLFGGISMDNTTGNRYFDFELYQTDIYYDRVSKKFYGYGPDAGHTSWQFDAAGNVIKAGDIILTGEFQSSVLTNIEARIWVPYTTWTSVTPASFNWSGLFDGATPGASFGYASIAPKTAGAFYTGLGCAADIWSGPFGLVLQDNSLQFTNPAPATTANGKYIQNQFIEFSVNLSKLGLDPTSNGTDVCGTPFNRLLVKTRSSSSFTADLKDFVAPTDLFLAPRVLAAADVPILCSTLNVSTIAVQDPYSSSYYSWSTTDGHIVGSNVGTSIVVDSPGTYIVTQRLSAFCNPYAYDTVTVIYDANCTTLDNNFLSFKGAIHNSVTRLDWTVAQNGDLSYFDIERSFDGRFFDYVGRVDVDPNQSLSANYTAYDDLSNLPEQPAVFYRLKLKKTTGATSYSKIIRIPYGTAITKVAIAPNPVKDVMQVTINSPEKDVMSVSIYDMSGKMMRKLETDLLAGVNVISMDNLSVMQGGMYMVVVSTSKETFRQKIIHTR